MKVNNVKAYLLPRRAAEWTDVKPLLLVKLETDVGLSGCLCYEVSDRNQPGEGIEENERFIRKCKDSDSDQVTAMFGLHASMTLSDETLDRCAEIGNELDTGFHVHAAEDAIDVETTRERHGKRVLDRFHERGMTGHKSIFVHGTHLEPAEMKLLAETDSMLKAWLTSAMASRA